jgi:hypothetical protein
VDARRRLTDSRYRVSAWIANDYAEDELREVEQTARRAGVERMTWQPSHPPIFRAYCPLGASHADADGLAELLRSLAGVREVAVGANPDPLPPTGPDWGPVGPPRPS